MLNHDGDRLTATEEGEPSGSCDAVVELLDARLVHVWFGLQLVLVAYEACPPQSYVVTELNLQTGARIIAVECVYVECECECVCECVLSVSVSVCVFVCVCVRDSQNILHSNLFLEKKCFYVSLT